MSLTAALGTQQRVIIDTTNLSQYIVTPKLGQEVMLHDITCLEAVAKAFYAGIKDGKLSMEGFFDYSTGAIHPTLLAALGSATGNNLSYAPSGWGVGSPVGFFVAKESAYEVGGAVADMVHVAAAFQADGGVDNGLSLHDILVDETATGVGAAQDNAASSANGAAAILHLLAFTGTNIIIKIRHSADNSTYTDLIQFATATGVTSERKTVTGTVNRYTKWDISGTFSSALFALALARR